ncbi:MAG: TRAP transporter substrate-binding protein [Sphingomonadales bacterium]|nr:TRAP transporter substrate-binding protein [Sphingomonadales bacterium]
MSDQNKSKSRRQFLKNAASIAGASAILAACGEGTDSSSADAPAVMRKKRTLKMVTTWPKNFPGLGTAATRFSKRVSDATDGLIDIRVYAAGELVPALSAFDAVSQGQADCYHGVEYYWQGKSKAFNFFAAVPFGMTAAELSAWIHHDGGQELWDELSAPFNIKPMLAGSTGVQMGGWFRKPINSIKDFQGLRMRMPGLGGEVIRRLGATPVTKAGDEIFLALSQGNIDATEWIGPWNDLAFGLHTIAKHYYYPGIHEPGTGLAVGFNKDIWESFTPAERAIIQDAATAEEAFVQAQFNANNARALKTLVEDHGVQLSMFPDDILKEMARISRDVLEETGNADDMTKRVYESFKASMARTSWWGEISEQAYAHARKIGAE